jgi:Skp family chaperone for outer membrane proteins
LPAPAPAQTPELDAMFNQAMNSLENSANRIESLQSELSESRHYVNSLETLSAEQRETLNRQAMTLEKQSGSLKDINERLTDISGQLLVYRMKLRTAIKYILVLAAILVLRFIGMIAGYILYAQGIRLPRWLDILL